MNNVGAETGSEEANALMLFADDDPVIMPTNLDRRFTKVTPGSQLATCVCHLNGFNCMYLAGNRTPAVQQQ